ncbi:MAG: thioredoxin family protein [Bacteroidia bacterium]|jgi:thioredoxin-related protein|nr:thioredoxin family protein [Bacteroidia bacterium]
MKIKILKSGLIVLLSIFSIAGFGQEAKKIYDPSLDGMKQINDAVAAAKVSGKHVLIQYGGNWCPWCIKFDGFSKADPEISKMIADNYIPVKLNYSPENKNEASNKYLGNPTRFGFPVFIIVDGKGKVIHIQDSGLLEEGEGYNQKKVVEFLRNWTASAITLPYISTPAKTKAEV